MRICVPSMAPIMPRNGEFLLKSAFTLSSSSPLGHEIISLAISFKHSMTLMKLLFNELLARSNLSPTELKSIIRLFVQKEEMFIRNLPI